MVTGGAARASRDGTMFFGVHMGEFVRVYVWVGARLKEKKKQDE